MSAANAEEVVWERISQPAACVRYACRLTALGTTLYASRTVKPVETFRSDDRGNSWLSINTGLNGSTSFVAIGSTLHAGNFWGIFRSENKGDSWMQVAGPLPEYSPSIWRVKALAALKTTLYAGTESGIFRSDDGGDSWTLAVAGVDVLAFKTVGETLYVSLRVSHPGVGGPGGRRANLSGDVFRLAESGRLLIPVDFTHFNGTSFLVRVFEEVGDALYAGAANLRTLSDPFGGGVYRSVDGGQSWTQTGLAGAPVLSLAAIGTTIYAGTEARGVFSSEDGGNSWTRVNTGLTNMYITSLVALGTTLYAATDKGIFAAHLPVADKEVAVQPRNKLSLMWGQIKHRR